MVDHCMQCLKLYWFQIEISLTNTQEKIIKCRREDLTTTCLHIKQHIDVEGGKLGVRVSGNKKVKKSWRVFKLLRLEFTILKSLNRLDTIKLLFICLWDFRTRHSLLMYKCI